ncbi:PREDICTED: uncharacterized protein LOC107328948 [Acropora digitifera]|uniref:uncharacterized protein LOC107328948 n=1 Tax=Acropora digitifera TaxID=70779 RepID=UPI00077A25C9|nr:PREDICTED: uncharacterized protein LOC107328948 [Acropora digitifera]
MSNTLEEASSWSFCPKPFEHTKKIKASRAIYAVKKKIQEGIHQHEGMACCVMVGNPRQMRFVTSSHVVAKLKARDHEPIEMHPSDKEKRKGGPVVVCSTVKEFGPFSFLAMDVPKLGVGQGKLTDLKFFKCYVETYVGVHCIFRTLSGVLLVVGTGSILRRCSTLDEFVIAFGVAVLPTAVLLRDMFEGSVCFVVQAETSLALEELYERYRTGRLRRDLQEFLVTDDIRQLADGEEVVLSVYINEKELREVLDDLTNVDVEAREATVWSSIRAVSQRIKGEVGVYCTFRTLSDVLLLVGTGSILRRCSTLDDFVIAFGVAVLFTAVILRSVSEGSVCFMVQAETSLALEELYERYRTGRLQRDLQEFLVTDDIRQLADGEEVVLSVYINEKELREVLDDLTDVERKDSRPAQSEGEGSVPGNELNVTATKDEGKSLTLPGNVESQESPSCDPKQIVLQLKEILLWSNPPRKQRK